MRPDFYATPAESPHRSVMVPRVTFVAAHLWILFAGLAGCKGAMFAQPVQCSGGAELVAGGCYCANGMLWNGQTCQGTPDPGPCQGGAYPFGPAGAVECHCMLGNTVDSSGSCQPLQCSGGAVPGDNLCVCPDSTQWDGSQCVGATADQAAPQDTTTATCPDGSTWDGSQCAVNATCPDGSTWDGSQCAVNDTSGSTSPPPRRTCLSVMGEKGYSPALWSACRGTNERCAVALLDAGFQPALLESCKNVDGACAEQLLRQGNQPALLADTCGRKQR